MADVVLLSLARMERIAPFFPLSHGIPAWMTAALSAASSLSCATVLRWRDAPPAYGPHKTQYNRFIRWRRLGIFAGLAGQGGELERLMIDSTYLKAVGPPPARSNGAVPAASDAPKAG